MPVKKIPLKSGKELIVPSLFINPRLASDGEVLREILTRYGKGEGHDGINQIDGIHIFFKDWSRVEKELSQAPLSDKEKEEFKKKLGEKLLLIDPGIHYLFTGTIKEKKDTVGSNAYPSQILSILEQIKKVRPGRGRVERYIEDVYPLFDDAAVKDLLKFQLAHTIHKSGVDFVILPSYPITSFEKIEDQIDEIAKINEKGNDLFTKDKIFKPFKGKLDSLSILTVNPQILTKKDLFEKLIDAMHVKEVDHLGIRLLNLEVKNENQISSVLDFIKTLHDKTQELTKKEKPIHIFNIREFGYVCYGYWASSVTTPIASDPYPRRSSGGVMEMLGSYYYPKKMVDFARARLMEITRSHNYRFPCHCEVCDEYERSAKVDESIWNKFRRKHFLLVKNQEVKEFRESESSLKVAVQQRFDRSKQTTWTPYLDDASSTF